MQGYPINWAGSNGNTRLTQHPLYIRFNSSLFDDIVIGDVRQALGQVMATADSAEVCAYLAWLIRTRQLLGDA